MKRGNNRYALYRTKSDPEGLRIRGRPYHDLGSDKQHVNMDHYQRIYLGEYEEKVSLKEIMVNLQLLTKDKLTEPVGTSDVLMLKRDGEPVCYYIDGDTLKLITKFIRPSSGGTVIEDSTKGAVIEGRTGKWDTVDSVILDGWVYYLMVNQKYKDTAGKIVVDSDGKLLLDDLSDGFSPVVKEKIRDAVKQTGPFPIHEEIPVQGQEDKEMLIWQKPYENGTWERRAESGTEANYDMVDGRVNNPAGSSKAAEEFGHHDTKVKSGPRRKRSVIRRLRRKQIEIAEKSGKPVSPYLMNERSRK